MGEILELVIEIGKLKGERDCLKERLAFLEDQNKELLKRIPVAND